MLNAKIFKSFDGNARSRIDSKIVQKISVQPKSNIIQQGNNE